MTDPLPRLTAALRDRYLIERELGQGGMATVYLAQDLKHLRRVALKVLRPELAASIGGDRFLREIKTTANLSHPHILSLYDSGDADGFLFYTMPVVEGESLRDRLDRERQLGIPEALQIVREMADALGYAHAQGLVHRDIKPENILLERGHAILADFGIARAADTAGADKLTGTGLAVGTPSYMSPEQSVGESQLDGRSDLYALGCVLYEMLAGEPPYSGPTAQAIIAKRFHEPVPRISVLRESVSAELEDVISQLLAKSPADRFATSELLSRALNNLPAAGSGTARHRGAPSAWKRYFRPAMVAGAILAAVATGYQLLSRRQATGGPLADDLIAIVPFTVHGSPDLEYLGEGMVDLVSAKLDGADGLRVANPRAVIAMVNSERVDLTDLVATQQVAQRLGAGRYVTGEVIDGGERIQLIAYLHQTAAPDSAPVRATAEGDAGQLLAVIDSLVFHLLSGTMSGPASRMRQLAVATTGSLPALKEYLQGERLMRVGGQYREAAEAYDRAIAIDTAFALAYYRKSHVAEWIDAYDVRSTADKAAGYTGRFSRRDQNLVEALRLRRHGETEEAEALYRAHLIEWPDDVDALGQLGEILFHDNPRRGRPMDEARPLFRRAVALEPANADARIHLARLYSLYDEPDSLAAQVAHFTSDAGTIEAGGSEARGGERLFELEALQAYASNDTAAQRGIREELVGKPWFYWFYAAHGVSRFAKNPAGALAMLEGSGSTEALLLMVQANSYQVLGQEVRFRQFMDSHPSYRAAVWDLLETFVLTSGAATPDTTRMLAALARIRRADPAAMRRDNWIPAYEDLTVEFHEFERQYHVALLLIHLDRLAEARSVVASLKAWAPLPNLGSLQTDVVLSLEADLLYQTGDRSGALAVLRQIRYAVPHGATYHAMADGARSRYLRAELELAQGDTTLAKGLYLGFDESWSPWDTYHRPVALERLGDIAAAQGRPAEAIHFYTRLIDMWREADPALVARRDEVRRRRDALAAAER